MTLALEHLRAAASGVCRMEERGDGLHFYRFTAEEEALYKARTPDYHRLTFSTAGVKLSFTTDSRTLSLAVEAVPSPSTEKFFSFDVRANGKAVGSLDNFSGMVIPDKYCELACALGEFRHVFDLGEGEKTVTVDFPFSVIAVLKELTLDDGASFRPCARKPILLAYGDSITHGYDALRPSHRYTALLAGMLGLEEVNKGIGGETFFPPLARCEQPFTPRIITVAYGTNDWSHKSLDEFTADSKAFYETLAARYPKTPVFAVTPVWRADIDEPKRMGPFSVSAETLRNVTAPLANVSVVDGLTLIDHDPAFFGDQWVHPNAAGFDQYASRLAAAIGEASR